MGAGRLKHDSGVEREWGLQKDKGQGAHSTLVFACCIEQSGGRQAWHRSVICICGYPSAGESASSAFAKAVARRSRLSDRLGPFCTFSPPAGRCRILGGTGGGEVEES